MAPISEIEKLARRWDENPHGLTFAPLAEAYRKNGEVHRALGVLQPGLELHPDYIPASIVLGRCHLDLGDAAGAEGAFSRVLELDPENVIALKALADLAERADRLDEAAGWVRQLLAVDASNDEARQQLERVDALRAERPVVADAAVQDEPPTDESFAPEVLDDEVLEPLDEAPLDEESIDAESIGTVWSEPVAEAPTEAPVEADHGVLAELDAIGGARARQETEAELEEQPHLAWITPPDEAASSYTMPPLLDEFAPADSEVDERPVSGDVPAGDDDFPGDTERLVELVEPVESIDGGDRFAVELAEEIVLRPAESNEYQSHDASAEFAARDEDEAELEESDGPESLTFIGGYSPDEPVDEGFEPSVPGEGADEPALVVTESMAELYLRQGHRGEALRVYRELLERSPDEDRLRQRVQELEQEDAAAAQAAGQSVRELLREVLAARPPAVEMPAAQLPPAEPPATPPAPAPAPEPSDGLGRPTRPAGDPLSLSAVFGGDDPSGGQSSAAAPAGRNDSFDDFFGAPEAAAADATRTTRPSPPPQERDEDLDQFNAWLQNLKR